VSRHGVTFVYPRALSPRRVGPLAALRRAANLRPSSLATRNVRDVCPTTLFEISNDLAALGEEAQSLQVIFVTVDPTRDTPQVLKEYLSSFDPRIVALTGSLDAIVRLAHTYGTTFRSLRSGEEYTIEHSPAVFLLGRDGQLTGVLSFNEDRQAHLAKLRELLR
jgi:protein SCO1/2